MWNATRVLGIEIIVRFDFSINTILSFNMSFNLRNINLKSLLFAFQSLNDIISVVESLLELTNLLFLVFCLIRLSFILIKHARVLLPRCLNLPLQPSRFLPLPVGPLTLAPKLLLETLLLLPEPLHLHFL